MTAFHNRHFAWPEFMVEGGGCLLRQKAFCIAAIDGRKAPLRVDTVEKGVALIGEQ